MTETEEEQESADRWWVVDPIGHRQFDQQRQREWLAQPATDGVQRFAMGIDLPADEWVCDYCNTDLDIYVRPGVPAVIPMFLSNALCGGCMAKQLKEVDPGNWLIAGAKGFSAGLWSNHVCSCPPCTARYDRMGEGTEENGQTREPDTAG